MKKTILTLTCSFALFFAAQSQVVITEIMYNPPESGTDSLEYIELYNNGNSSVNMENWSLFGVVFTFPAITLAPDQYVVVAVNAAVMQNQFGVAALQWTSGGLNNNGETIRLLDAGSNVIDEVTYSNTTPWPTAAAGNGPSIVLCDPDSDNNVAANWQAASTSTGITINGHEVLANPGAASDCVTALDAKTDFYNLPQNKTSILNVISNDAIPDLPNITVTISITPIAGSATVNSNNTIAYTPPPNFCGNDEFFYQICDNSDCDTATVHIKVRCYPSYTIPLVTSENATSGLADSVGASCELTGTVYGINLRASATGSQFTLIDDNNNGINIFSPTTTLGYTVKEKDKIVVRGVIGQFNGLTQITPDTILKASANNPLVAPLVVVKPDESTESQLIKINNLHFVDPLQWTTGMGVGGFNVQVVSDDHPQDTIVVRIDNDVDLYNQPAPPQPFDLTGIGGQFDSSSPYTSGYQIAPRYIPDVSSLVRTKEVDFSANIRLSPNPTSARLLLQTDLQFDRVKIFAATGILLKDLENPLQTQEIQVNNFPSGVYFMQFEKENAVWTTRFVKQ